MSAATTIRTREMHTGGEPLRIVESGYPRLPEHGSILETRRYVRAHLDHLRRLLMLEPRGHKDMYGALILDNLPGGRRWSAAGGAGGQSTSDDGGEDAIHLSVLFMHNEGYSTMCGHAIIALARYAVDTGLVAVRYPESRVNIECPCGVVPAHVECRQVTEGAGGSGGSKVTRTGQARFTSVPAFLLTTAPAQISLPGYGVSGHAVPVEVAYGGAFYAIVTDSDLGVSVTTDSIADITKAATAVSDAVREAVHAGTIPPLYHPDSEDLSYLYGTIVTDGRDTADRHGTHSSVNLTVFADQAVDRCPTGSGITARIALQLARGYISMGETRVFVSAATGSELSGRPVETLRYGDYDAVRVEVKGRAYYCGAAEFSVEEDDPLKGGFLLR